MKNKFKNFLLISSCYLIHYISDEADKESDFKPNTRLNKENSYQNYLDNYFTPVKEIFQAENFILQNQLKDHYHKSIPFNRKISYIYNLPFFYIEYENYNFNKLSDLFLNIHIFIN